MAQRNPSSSIIGSAGSSPRALPHDPVRRPSDGGPSDPARVPRIDATTRGPGRSGFRAFRARPPVDEGLAPVEALVARGGRAQPR